MSLTSIITRMSSAEILSALNDNYTLLNTCIDDAAEITEITDSLIGSDLINAINTNNENLNAIIDVTIYAVSIGQRGIDFNLALNNTFVNLENIASEIYIDSITDNIAFWINDNDNVVGTGAENETVVFMSTDDNLATDYTVAFPYLAAINSPISAYIVGDQVNGGSYCTEAQLREMKAAGYDMLFHANHHPQGLGPPDDPEYETWSDEELRADMTDGLAAMDGFGLGTPSHFTPPRFSSFYPNVRRIGSEFFNGMRTGINNHNMSWDKVERTAVGMIAAPMNTDVSLTDIKNGLDVAIENKTILPVYFHGLQDAAAIQRFKDFVDYCVLKGVPIIKFTELYARIESHRGHYVDKVKGINLLTILFEQREFGDKDGWIIFSDTLETVTSEIADFLVNDLNYKVGFYTDESNDAFAYAIPDDAFRAFLQGEGINSIYDIIESARALIFLTSTAVMDINNFGLEYFTSANSFSLINMINLTGTIPKSIKSLTRCGYLKIALTGITGSIPIEIANLIDLEELLIYSNAGLTGYEKGAICVHHSRLNNIVLTGNALTEQAVNDIICDLRYMIAVQKNFHVPYPPATPEYVLNLSGGTNAAPTGEGLTAKYQLENAITELGGTVDWTVTTN